MLLPYASDRPPNRAPIATWVLMGVQAILLLTLLAFSRDSGVWRMGYALATFGIVPAHLHLWTLLTYSFLHVNIAHLLTNLFFLWIFGAGVEEAIGPVRFVAVYLAAGAFGGALQALITVTVLPPLFGTIPIVGASAACAGLMGVFAVRYYRARLKFVGLPRPLHVVTVITLFLGLEIVAALWRLWTGAQADGVAHWAHVGGFIFGLAWAQWAHLSDEAEREYLKQDAAQAMDTNVPGEAIRRWEAVLRREPDSISARLELARAWILLGDYEQASEHYLAAIRRQLASARASEAALLYEAMRRDGLPAPAFTDAELALLSDALEESESHALAAEVLRALAARQPAAPESEMALLKVISLYIHHLDRRDEAEALLTLFLERYPNSPWRKQAESLRRT